MATDLISVLIVISLVNTLCLILAIYLDMARMLLQFIRMPCDSWQKKTMKKKKKIKNKKPPQIILSFERVFS